jgi:hypothetical protein
MPREEPLLPQQRRNAEEADPAEEAASAPLQVEMRQTGTPLLSIQDPNLYSLRRRDHSAHTEQIQPFRQIAVTDPRSAVERGR